ncbi:hypothetical protein FH972_021007 [Carpinus fangiana]|uniref:Uncharacterized protein n=1 Tax=Carpinus fangiana TaxID=176857 RepID=A0A5N6KQ67_9ROSI|nr:hypothetical protein FH972_021007 [Carpinus fangiana]
MEKRSKQTLYLLVQHHGHSLVILRLHQKLCIDDPRAVTWNLAIFMPTFFGYMRIWARTPQSRSTGWESYPILCQGRCLGR